MRQTRFGCGRSPRQELPKTENRTRKTLDEAETIGTTANDPFWSVDRQEFVQAGSLEVGERLRTLSGDVKVVQQKLPRPGPQPVFNLEVHDEHVYFVGEDGVLVHNAGPYVKTEIALGKDIPGAGYKELAAQTGASRWQNWNTGSTTNEADFLGRWPRLNSVAPSGRVALLVPGCSFL